jgi:hypothetical protein
MPLLNYTTSIVVEKTLGEVQGMLARAKAKRITLDYTNGAPSAVEFAVDTRMGERWFALPANVDAVQTTLRRQNVTLKYQSREHAARVAWRIIKDWLEAQLALIESGMVTLDEVMLPYMLMENGQTLYLNVLEKHLALPAAGEASR